MSDDDQGPLSPEVEAFFAASGGGGNPYLQRLRLSDGSRLHRVRVAVVVTTLAWLPALILAVVDGVAWGRGVEVPFVRDFLRYGQLFAFVITSVLTLLLPLLAFVPKLVRAREEQLVVLSSQGHRGADSSSSRRS